MGHWNDGERDLNAWFLGTAIATTILDVAVQEVVVWDKSRVASWGHVGKHENFFWGSWNLWIWTEKSSSLYFAFLSWFDIVVDFGEIKIHSERSLIWAPSRHSCKVFVFQREVDIELLMSMWASEVKFLSYLKFDFYDIQITFMVVDRDICPRLLIVVENILVKTDWSFSMALRCATACLQWHSLFCHCSNLVSNRLFMNNK